VALVEDDSAIAEMYRLGLEDAGYRVAVFEDAGGFFRSSDVEIPAAAVLDFQLQGVITGIDILENLRLFDSMVHMPVFVLSNHAGHDDGQIDRAMRAGARAWLVKSATTPFRLAEYVSEALGSPPNGRAASNGAAGAHSESIAHLTTGLGSLDEPAAQSG
jgi:DNA-binding response OmpR family regulator